MIQTIRCELTTLQNRDWELVMKLYTNVEVRRFLGGIIDLQNVRRKFWKMLQSDRAKYWVIRVKENDLKCGIGIVCLSKHHNNIDTEISYQLLPQWWNKGYGSEAVGAIIERALTIDRLPRVIAETQIANTASCQLLESIGMSLERTVERFGAKQGIFST